MASASLFDSNAPHMAHESGARPEADGYVISGGNPLIAAANPILDLVPQIRSTPSHPSPAMLRDQLVREVQQFELRARESGLADEMILGARYCLCTALDEAAALTPWGGGGIWSAHSLLVTFHNETAGGEKFFQLLAKLSQTPEQYIDLLELLYYCLLLGFEGRYRVLDNGQSQLETLRQRLLRILRAARGEYQRELSPHWRDSMVPPAPRRLPVPAWVVAVLVSVMALVCYFSLVWRLGDISDGVFAAIHGLEIPHLQPARVLAPPRVAPPRLAALLEPEVREKLVSVRDEQDRSVVVIQGNGLFDLGAASVRARYLSVLSRIADALRPLNGAILVTGYTDNLPSRGVRFPSNWHLSQARADAVKNILERRLHDANRVRAEGRGDTAPLVPNDSPAHRAKNRRVEITLFASPSAQAMSSKQELQ